MSPARILAISRVMSATVTRRGDEPPRFTDGDESDGDESVGDGDCEGEGDKGEPLALL